MSQPDLLFPQYGRGGDRSGARRARRAFRFCVLLFVLLALSLWFAEYFLRYKTAEYLYLNSLTHQPESGRVFLQQAVKVGEQTNDRDTVKYLQALAARQDPEYAVETYKKAYALDHENPSLDIRYGNALFLSNHYQEALDMFHEAGNQPPKNALPVYLEAATLPHVKGGKEKLDESLALVARTNNSGLKITFPKPLWFPSLPQDGMWYARLRRGIVDKCCALLYQYSVEVVNSAEKDSTLRQAQYWGPWLEQLQTMGARLVNSADPGTVQATAGVRIQLEALQARLKIAQHTQEHPDPALLAQKANLEKALTLLNGFEGARDARIAHERAAYRLPMQLAFSGFLALLVIYGLAYIAAKSVHAGRLSWTIPHTKLAKITVVAFPILVLAVLHTFTVLQGIGDTRSAALNGTRDIWWVLILLVVAFGLAYPLLTLPRPAQVLRMGGETGESENPAQAARREYLQAYFSLQRRYFGLILGCFLCSVATWIITFRLFQQLYPWQIKLLASGLGQEELALVHQVQHLLS